MNTHRSLLSKITLLLFIVLAPATLCDDNVNCQVIDVTDGASINILYDGKPTPCLYIGVSAPETGNAMSSKALQFNKELVDGKTVRLEFDSQKYDKDGHLLAYVYCGEIFINAEIIKQGYGTIAITSPNTKYASQFLKLESEAREAKRGLWSEDITADISPQSEINIENRIAILEKRIDELSKKVDMLLEIIQKLQSQPITKQSVEEGQIQTVYITSYGKKYHKQGCKSLANSGKPISIEEAKQKGYEPCKTCFGAKEP